MAVKHGAVGEFNSDQEDWVSYTERLVQYFVANGISEEGDKRRAILLSSCGPTTYQLLRNLVAPGKPTDKSFTQIVELVRDHHQPRPSTIVQRFNFHTRSQKPGEKISEFVAQLRKLSEHCSFGEGLQDMLRDRLVCGCKDHRLQCKLLAETDLTFEKAFKIAKAAETAEKEARDLHDSPAAQPVHVIKGTRSNKHAQRAQTLPQGKSVLPICYRCGAKHKATECRFKEAECNFCKKKGHIAKVCHSRLKQKSGTHQMPAEDDTEPLEYSLFHTQSSNRSPPILITLKVNGADLTMELDTGATLSLISENTYKKIFPVETAPHILNSKAQLKTYTGEVIKVLGAIEVEVTHNEQKKRMNLLVVAGDGPSLLGRDWLSHIRLDWSTLNRIQSTATSACQEILDQHNALFKDELGTVKNTTAKFNIDPQVKPKFFKARPVPYALRPKVEAQLDKLEAAGIIRPLQFSQWAAPIVPVLKRDGSIRICGDYKVTVNLAAKTDTYPLPKIEDLFASLSGGKLFSKVDLASAYQQIPLDEQSKEFTTINTPKGLYCYNRLPFGVASAPSIFQRTMESILQGIDHVCVYLDDILITGATEKEHLQNLDKVLTRLESAVEYLGHKISGQGLQPTDEKIQAIKSAPAPQDVTQLKSFLGLINYYSKFLPNLSNTLAPLYRLLQKNTRWCWESEQRKAFQQAKESLTSDCVLVHFDPAKQLILACDASPYGIGAVLSHRMDDGKDKPIAFSSRTLAPAEKKYSQLEKEGLAVIFGVKKFRQYLLGRSFTIVSDHKPLQYLFNESRVTPTLASARIQRWSWTLGAYHYNIEYKPGQHNGNADMLSRLPLPETPTDIPMPGETILVIDMLLSLPVTVEQIRQWTTHDPILSRVRALVQQGWQDTDDVALKPFQRRKYELSIHDGCLLWGSRVVVPPQGRDKVKQELHEGHPGATRMKALARSFVWWPQIDQDLEELVKRCDDCQRFRNQPPVVPLQPWEWPEKPWIRVHADYAGPFLGRQFLILVDAHSKWMEVKVVNNATSAVTIDQMCSIFATHGIPEMLVTDNGTVFTSEEFNSFTKQNGIRHVTSAPYHPSSNGLAERAVQTFKSFMKKSTSGSIEARVSRFLMHYRITPQTTTGISPAEMMMGRRPRSRLDLLIPNLATKMQHKQQSQKHYHDKRSRQRICEVGDRVNVKNFPTGDNWLQGTIVKVSGPLSFQVKLQDGRIVRRHVDHIIQRSPQMPDKPNDDWISMPDIPESTLTKQSATTSTTTPPSLRRSTRVSVPPKRYGQETTRT